MLVGITKCHTLKEGSCLLVERSRCQDTAGQVLKLRKELETERAQVRGKHSKLEEDNAALCKRMQESQQEHMEVIAQLRKANHQVRQLLSKHPVTEVNSGQSCARLLYVVLF